MRQSKPRTDPAPTIEQPCVVKRVLPWETDDPQCDKEQV